MIMGQLIGNVDSDDKTSGLNDKKNENFGTCPYCLKLGRFIINNISSSTIPQLASIQV